jgi:hypothetical protein
MLLSLASLSLWPCCCHGDDILSLLFLSIYCHNNKSSLFNTLLWLPFMSFAICPKKETTLYLLTIFLKLFIMPLLSINSYLKPCTKTPSIYNIYTLINNVPGLLLPIWIRRMKTRLLLIRWSLIMSILVISRSKEE